MSSQTTDTPATASFPRFFRNWFSRLPIYLNKDLRHDFLSGTTVAIMGIPQAMAYALIAGVPPVYGLYTAIVSCIVGSLFGSSSHLVTGPTNATCMVLLSVSAPYTGEMNAVEIILFLTFMAGIIKMALGLLRLGGIVRYVSNSVVVGFTAGAGILIAANQLSSVMGISIPKEQADHIYTVLYETAARIPSVNPYTLAIGLFTAFFVLFSRKVDKRIPGPLLGVTFSALIVLVLGWDEKGVQILREMGQPIERSLDIFHVPQFLSHPSFRLFQNLSGGALAVAILGLVEAASSSRAVASASGQRLNFSREFFAQGLSNIVGSFFLNFAGSGSFTRTALCYQSGGRTRMAPIFSALWTILTILLLAPLANYIPKASLAGMLIVIAYSMVEKNRLNLALRAGLNSRIVFGMTLGATLLFPLHYAIFIGVFVSLIFLLKITGKPDLTQLVPRPDGRFDEVPFEQAVQAPIVLVNMEGDLYFAAVEDLDYELQRVLTPQTRVVVLRMKRLRAVGSTAMAILDHFAVILNQKGLTLVVCGLEPDLADLMTRSGLRVRIGEQNIFYADNTIFRSTELAMARARHILEMERLREKLTPIPGVGGQIPKPAKICARDLVSRQCVRFGEGHSLREASLLLSEMNKRQQTPEPQPLFLQNRQGRLASMLSPWRILRELTEELANGDSVPDEEWAKMVVPHLGKKISDIAQEDLPRLTLDSSFVDILEQALRSDLSFLPILDDEDRVIGLISQHDLLMGMGKMINMFSAMAPKESPAKTT